MEVYSENYYICQEFSRRCNEQALELYESGEHHDCSFLIDDQDSKKVFKCHKLFLSLASPVFKAMLLGTFCEARRDADDPIRIGHVSPKCFEAAMRFIYGKREPHVENLREAIEIFKFAHEWQIECLRLVIENKFKNYELVKVGGDLLLYEMFNFLENETRAQRHFQRLVANCEKVVETEEWLLTSKETVAALLADDTLNTKDEGLLFVALAKWAANQADCEDVVRDLLPLIRFGAMGGVRFAELSDACHFLADDLKGAISEWLLDVGQTPPHGVSASSEPRGRKALLSALLAVDVAPTVVKLRQASTSVPLETRFSVSADDDLVENHVFNLVGVSLYSADVLNVGQRVDIYFECKQAQMVLASGHFQSEENEGGDRLHYLDPSVPISTNLTYVLHVQHRTESSQMAVLRNAGDNCFAKIIRGHLLQVGRIGDVNRFYFQ